MRYFAGYEDRSNNTFYSFTPGAGTVGNAAFVVAVQAYDSAASAFFPKYERLADHFEKYFDVDRIISNI